jgi:hypothetical protein
MHYFAIEMQWAELHDNATNLMHYNGLKERSCIIMD